MHILGLKGMTRRIYTYPSEMGWEPANLLATVGAFVILLGGVLFLANVYRSLHSGELAGPNPWNGSTLEWLADSPPAPYNFPQLPAVESIVPLWDQEQTVVTGLRDDRREALVTSLMDGAPQHRFVLPGPSIWPFLTALGASIGLSGSVFQFAWYYVAMVLAGIGLVGWFWPRPPLALEP